MSETTNRVLALLNLLQTHRQWTGEDLSRRMGVTGRTLRRDIERLRVLGYRVEATRGATGGYRLEAGSQLPPLLLTDAEAVTMAIGLRLAATQGLEDGDQTTLSALAKFEQILPTALRRRVNALVSEVSSPDPRGAVISPDLLSRLALACRDHERIRFHYVAAGGQGSDRVTEPNALVANGRTWYLVSWDLDRRDWRTFRVDRMSTFFGTGLRFAPRQLPEADAAEFVAAAATARRHRHQAHVVMGWGLAEMTKYFGPWAQGATAVDEGHTRWPIGGESWEAMLGALLWIPPGVDYRIEGPPEFTDFVAEWAHRLHNAAALSSGR